MNIYRLSVSFFTFFALLIISFNTQAATVSGTIKYEGEIPKLRPIKMDADPICLTHHQDQVVPQVLLLGDDKTLGNVYVHITKGLPKKAYSAPTEPAVLDQKGCMYDPHVIGIMVNQPLKILNPDGTLHNVHALSKKNPEFNIAMPKFRKEITKTFKEPEFMFGVKCDVHPWMGAWVTVSEHPFFSVTKEDGVFEIKDLPPGSYELEAWHEKLGTQTAQVEIASDSDTQEISFTFSRPEKK